MAKEVYYLRSKLDQDLFAYLEIGETWEESFLMEFKLSSDAPLATRTGASVENRRVLLLFKKIGLSTYEDAIKEKYQEWIPIEPDNQIKYISETLANSSIYNNKQ